MTDGVAFAGGGNWSKQRLDGRYVAKWRTRPVGRSSAVRACCPHRGALGHRSPAETFDRGRDGSGGALRALRSQRTDRGTFDRRIWAITGLEGHVTSCVELNPLALRLR